MIAATTKYTFSGHETFACRNLWLKKGYDYIVSGKSFRDEDAVVKLGVGKNMVGAIKYWMKSFNILTSDDQITEFGNKLLADDGWDPYLEDHGTLWLLHYQLVKTNYASIYNIIFTHFRRERMSFNKDMFVSYMIKRSDIEGTGNLNTNTLSSDFAIFSRMYSGYKPTSHKDSEMEELNSKFFSDLGLLDVIETEINNDKKGTEERYQIIDDERFELPNEIFLYSIMDTFQDTTSVSLKQIENENNGPGLIFAINHKGISDKLKDIDQKNQDVVYSEQSGIKEIQWKNRLVPFNILNKYYEQ
jgi:hypothetical protein